MCDYVSGLMGRLQGVAMHQPYLEHFSLDYYDWTDSSPASKLKLTLRNVGSASINIGGC